MNKTIDLTGKVFGKLTALQKAEKASDGRAQWLCQCSCGTKKIIRQKNLKRGTTKSCGCLRKKNLLNQKFGKLTAIKEAGFDEKGHILWFCNCDCGKTRIVRSTSLISGAITSCGCNKRKDLSGQRFGSLVAIEATNQRTKDGLVVWKCKCDCGRITFIASSNLISGNSQTCGCHRMSRGEAKIKEILDFNNINYKQEYVIPEIGNKRFDFAILNNKEEVIKLIEYDGEQHFQEWTLSAKTTLAERQESDRIKDEWAAAHNIPLLRIPYWDYNKIDFDMLQLI